MKKAMILAAGYGRRLLPVTEFLPKPVVQILNLPNIAYNILLLKKYGIEDIAINLFHLHDSIESHLGNGKKWGVRLHYFHEKELLGTGGGVKNAESFFEGQAFILCNCDLITQAPLDKLIAFHQAKASLATMLLYENPSLAHQYAKVGVDGRGHLCALPKFQTRKPEREGIFTGIHVLENQCLDSLEPVFSGINDVLYPALMENLPHRTYGYFHSGMNWYDTGDLPSIWSTSMALMESLCDNNHPMHAFMIDSQAFFQIRPQVWSTSATQSGALLPPTQGSLLVGENTHWGPHIELKSHVVVGRNAVVGQGAVLENCVLLEGAQVQAYQTVSHAIVFGQEVIPAHPPLQA